MGCEVPTFKILPVIMAAVIFARCAQDSGMEGLIGKKSGSNSFNAGERTATFDFQKECGLSKEQLDSKDAVLVSGSYTSFPIIIQGESMGVKFVVITQAKVNVKATGSSSVQEQNVELKESATSAGGFIKLIADGVAKGKAQTAAKENSGSTTATPMPKGEWLKLTDGRNAEYKDLLCATSGTRTTNINKGDKNATVTFSPGLISAVNPLAPIARLRKEIGPSRSFAVTADVQGDGNGLASGSLQGRVTVREISPIFKYENTTIKTDIAYEFINEFPGGAHKVGLPKRQVYYIDSTKKIIRAIISEDDKIDPNSKKPLPPVYLVRDP
jgi:hypothetical protein